MRKKSQKGGLVGGVVVEDLSDSESESDSDSDEEEEEEEVAAGAAESGTAAPGGTNATQEEDRAKRQPRKLQLYSGMTNKPDPDQGQDSPIIVERAKESVEARRKSRDSFVTQKLKKGTRYFRNGARTLHNRFSGKKKTKPSK